MLLKLPQLYWAQLNYIAYFQVRCDLLRFVGKRKPVTSQLQLNRPLDFVDYRN